ncbi:hypothetical protein [Hyalangium versicolor]|uniref:hypothetical protein n=1 Tax=Hyalangium versicolor TaxID=2861190 RepID=UPI001CCDAC94|nr:hypothetical protein [Hyalangium versicolor]
MATGIPRPTFKIPLLVATGIFTTLFAGCAHGPCKTLGTLFGCSCSPQQEQPVSQDSNIALPDLDDVAPSDIDLDGYTLQAIRLAADDFLNPDPTDLPCKDKQVSHRYLARRQGDVIFVRIDFKPANCGREFSPLDSGATYAISVDGRILRRAIDGLDSYSSPPTPSSTGSNKVDSEAPLKQ